MLERKIGKFMFKNIEEYYKKSILPPSSAKSIRVQSILGEIVQAMHNGLRLEKNCSVNMCSSENPQVIMAVDGSGQQQHDFEVRVEKLGNENDVKRIGKLGRRFATKHLDGLNWEVMLVDSSYTKNAYYIPEGRIVVFTGLLDCLQSDAELATILAHETLNSPSNYMKYCFLSSPGGIVLDSMISQITSLILFTIVEMLGVLYMDDLSQLFFLAMFMWGMMEFEADYIGLMLMASAGYDPQEAPKVYEVRLGDEDRGLSATHPSGSKRAEKLNKPKVMQKAVAIYKEVKSGQGVTSFI
ncbi:mitochondrial metalloendopeptidase OMA1-like [Camellia sinensis]|uniref:mitochondrial metalloendopeptidase OMA1-like n=1 Tax=Camellia sinensis TaxID=4442 RepID=UPI00103636C6|nr:mitochondrial metalloendopeptidase OMA1-like [Camellia sinensis]